MALHLIAVGTRMPAWVNAAFEDYARRLPPPYNLPLTEITAAARSSGKTTAALLKTEAARITRVLPASGSYVALDERGKAFTTLQLAERLQAWVQTKSGMGLVIGGADGLHAEIKNNARQLWSLSPLTLPHGLVRVIVAEQIYRAWSLLTNHPYHRA